jgi:hypothetical protein
MQQMQHCKPRGSLVLHLEGRSRIHWSLPPFRQLSTPRQVPNFRPPTTQRRYKAVSLSANGTVMASPRTAHSVERTALHPWQTPLSARILCCRSSECLVKSWYLEGNAAEGRGGARGISNERLIGSLSPKECGLCEKLKALPYGTKYAFRDEGAMSFPESLPCRR